MSTITLTVGASTLTLPSDLYWSDETNWTAVEQKADRSITGSNLIQVGRRLAGRPITLEPPIERASWMQRAVIDQLRAWADVPGQQMTLVLRGVPRTVIWRHQEPPVMAARPVMHFDDVQPDDAYTATLKFMEI